MGTNSRLRNPASVTVKWSLLTATPSGVTTLMAPLVASAGTTARRRVVDIISNSDALTPLKLTSVAPRKRVPVTVTPVPTGPPAGAKPLTVGAAAAVVATTSFEKADAPALLKACTR